LLFLCSSGAFPFHGGARFCLLSLLFCFVSSGLSSRTGARKQVFKNKNYIICTPLPPSVSICHLCFSKMKWSFSFVCKTGTFNKDEMGGFVCMHNRNFNCILSDMIINVKL
jgi:hypothetical protein